MEGPLTRAEWVDRRLRHAIITGEFRPGERLVTEELARRWSVSPTPLREGYNRLAAEGLVELLPQRGARVARVSLADALEIYDIRQMLEPHALRVSLQHRDATWERDVRQTYDRLREQFATGLDDLVAFETAHQAFHSALLAHCQSGWLLRIIRTLQDHSVRYRLLSLAPRGGPAGVQAEHDALLAACVAGEVDSAVAQLRDHIQLTVDSVTAAGENLEVTR